VALNVIKRAAAAVAIASASVAAAPATAQSTRTASPPNVVVILTDDQGWGDLSINGNANLDTGHLDSLARDGARFERFYVQPVCSPTRAEFLTGRYHVRGGVHDTSRGGERLDADERTIAQVFKSGGYATGAFGKWHNGTQGPYHPNARGFDEFYGFTSGHWGDYFSPPLDHNGRIVQGNGFMADDFAQRAMKFVEQNKDRPFFVYLPFNTPHTPAQVPDAFYKKFADPKNPKLDAKTRAVYAMCENIDWNVGRVLGQIQQLNLSERTIVAHFHDNGPNGARWNGGMKGIKGSTDEGGVRSPLHVRWPGRIKPGTRVEPVAGAIDLLPTLADLAGVKIAGGKPLDGVSLKPLLLDGAAAKDWPARVIYNCWNGKVSARTDTHRLDAAGRLYDMRTDPGQTRDVAGEQPEVAQQMRSGVAGWKKNVLSELGRDDRPFPVGAGPLAATQLPARDGVPHGHIQRSGSAPNCSFFRNWVRPQDTITWDVDVVAAGRYEASIHYACAKADVGAAIELSLNGVSVKARVTDAHDPPLRGMEHDRAPRGSESYVKDFGTMSLGTLDLRAGRGELTLSALAKPGNQVMEVRMIVLTRVEPADRR
jgi:arylsulfatase A-like enzyme